MLWTSLDPDSKEQSNIYETTGSLNTEWTSDDLKQFF